MNLVNPKSIDGYVNHFADYILSYTNNIHIVIKVTFHFPNIMVVSGSDHTKTIYNFNKIHKDFLTQFPMYEEIIGTKDITIVDLLHDQYNHKGFINTFYSYKIVGVFQQQGQRTSVLSERALLCSCWKPETLTV